jgi:hypothetical protein
VDNLPVVPHDQVVRLPDGTYAYSPQPLTPAQAPAPQVVHVHQAPPDRTMQRIALGSGVGAGAVAAGVYFGPLLVGVLTAMAADLAILAFLAVALTWGIVHLVRSIGGPEGKEAAKNLSKTRRRG